jgi:hypothetical protein
MHVYRSRWILPIDRPPIDGGWVSVDGGRITAIGDGRPPGRADDLGDVAILPALVNAHTHVELSWMAGQVPAAAAMPEWIRAVLRRWLAGRGRGAAASPEGIRGGGGGRAGPPADDAPRVDAMRRAAAEMRATGTALVGDVSNTLTSVLPIVESGLAAVVFHEAQSARCRVFCRRARSVFLFG